jgi:hypothetical protein
MKIVIPAVLLLVLTGCGLQHQGIRLEIPDARVNPIAGKPLAIVEVTDSRPPQAQASFSAAQRAHNVGGVFRGGGGIAVDLEDDTVANQTRAIATQAFRAMGYTVTDSGSTPADAVFVSLIVTKFDVDMPFNLLRAATYSQKMYADISTHVTIQDGVNKSAFDVDGHGENVYEVVSQENWETALNRAVESYSHQLKARMAAHD